MSGHAEEVYPDNESLEIKVIRKIGKSRFVIALYVLEEPALMGLTINFLNSNSQKPILEDYLKYLEMIARQKCKEELQGAADNEI